METQIEDIPRYRKRDGKPMGKPGRPRSEPTKPVMLRLTETQRKKYIERGGARWVKRLIDAL